jgi:hypothetical protein
MHAILATWEAEMRRISVQGQQGQIGAGPQVQNQLEQNGLEEWIKQ